MHTYAPTLWFYHAIHHASIDVVEGLGTTIRMSVVYDMRSIVLNIVDIKIITVLPSGRRQGSLMHTYAPKL